MHSGLCQEFLAGVLDAQGVSIDLPEALLRLACNDCQEYTIDSQAEEFIQLNARAKGKYFLQSDHASFLPP